MSAGREQAQARETALARSLVGRTVLDVFVASDRTAYVILDDGRALVAMCDPEGNGPGALHVYGEPPIVNGRDAGEPPFLGIVGGS